MSETKMIIVFSTVASKDEADKLAKELVEKRHAACVQIIGGVESVYEWKGAINVDSEYLLLIKTTAENFRGLESYLKTKHSYEVPEIVAVPASAVSSKYLSWLEKAVK